MYQFITGFYKTQLNKVDWIEDPNVISKEPLFLLYTKYYQVRIILKAPSLSKLQIININDLPQNARGYNDTILAYLKHNGDNRLTTINYIEYKKPGQVKYLNYITQGYKTTAINITKHETANINRDQKVDALLHKDGLYRVDYDDIVNNSVSICNGLLHRSLSSNNGVCILGAGTTTRLSNIHSFGLLDFSEIGKITTLPINKDNIIQYIPGTNMNNTIYLRVPEKYAGKAVMISIGGYLYYTGSILSRISETIFKIDTSKANIIKRLYEAAKYGFDLSSIGLSRIDGCPDIYLDEISTDIFYYNLLTHQQSFFIIADVNDYYVEKVQLENPKLPGKYLVESLPKYPIISELGIIPNFNYRHVDNTYILHTDLLTRNNHIYTTTQWKRNNRVSFHIDPYNPRYYQNAYTLIIKYSTT